jgi:hypothetical protein
MFISSLVKELLIFIELADPGAQKAASPPLTCGNLQPVKEESSM